jgi:hypothetical protein
MKENNYIFILKIIITLIIFVGFVLFVQTTVDDALHLF